MTPSGESNSRRRDPLEVLDQLLENYRQAELYVIGDTSSDIEWETRQLELTIKGWRDQMELALEFYRQLVLDE